MSHDVSFSARLGRRRLPTSLGLTASSARRELLSRIVAEGVLEDTTALGVLSVAEGPRILVPTWQFTSIDPLVLHPDIPSLCALLGGVEDPLGAIGWFLTPNGWLDGELPSRVLHLSDPWAIAFAAQQLTNDSW